jgi:hypothetical protein
MAVLDTVLDWIGRRIARGLTRASSGYEPFTHADPAALQRALLPADVLLVAGNRKLSTAIKYLTQSTWSHAALYIGDALGTPAGGEEPKRLIEVEVGQGCIAVPLSKYATFNTRICRPIGLSEEDCRKVVSFMIDRIGLRQRPSVPAARAALCGSASRPCPPWHSGLGVLAKAAGGLSCREAHKACSCNGISCVFQAFFSSASFRGH